MDLPLTPELVLAGYRAGIFPMGVEGGEIAWFSPDPRCIIPLQPVEAFRTPRSLRQTIRRGAFEIRVNSAFAEVVAGCADRDEGTWISPEIAAVYTELHRRGYAHSVEAWHAGALAGGLYGVVIGGAFFGESMFTRVTDASKVALVRLVERLRERGFVLLDTQWSTPHLARFGAVEIRRREYLLRLKSAVGLPRRFCDELACP
ncbi:MAG: leucyl/phenylalanyl-tRNA--protein transferase [Planctomycetota bacterium]